MLSRKPWIAPVPGTTNPAHLDDFLGGASVRLSEPELKEFDLAWGFPFDPSIRMILMLDYYYYRSPHE